MRCFRIGSFGLLLVSALCLRACAECPTGDINTDCRVNAADLLLLADQWLTETETPADLNGDGCVDTEDLAVLGRHWRQEACPIVINEVLAHSHADASDWIELHNLSHETIDIGGWFLSDTRSDLLRYELAAGTTVEPNGYVVLYETAHFGNPFDPGMRTPFAFSENGETAVLFSADDPLFPNCVVEEPFGASETDFSFGRHRTSTNTCDFVLLQGVTPGRANTGPLVGPIVINEIMYRPAIDGDAEYLELLNITAGPIALFDFAALEPWRLMDESGIDFRFPTDVPVTLDAGEHILLVRDRDAMGSYSIPTTAQVFDWGSGKLANGGENLRLLKPGDVDDRGIRYWIEVDVVRYSDGSHGHELPGNVDPWPSQADGGGLSLNRLWPSHYGNDPNNWHATIPTPGATND